MLCLEYQQTCIRHAREAQLLYVKCTFYNVPQYRYVEQNANFVYVSEFCGFFPREFVIFRNRVFMLNLVTLSDYS